jgi:GTP-binding protein EngB required for normal cell division
MVQVDGILNRVSRLANELKLANLQPQIAACEGLMRGHNGMDVAVFGRFKAGKSSFLNQLAGRDVLPIGVVPLTAVITRLRFGPVERAEVCYVDGRAEVIPVSDIGLFVGENENHENWKQVASVEVELPALEGLAPLQFVDTPGLGSAFTHNTEAAMQWLPNVCAAVVAVSSDAPLSEDDLALVEQLHHHTPKIVLLLTKADLLTEAQRAEVLAFVQQQLRRKWETQLPVFFYSIQPALYTLKRNLERDLLVPLIQHRRETSQSIARHKLASLVVQTLDYLHVALAAATQAESSRQALRDKLGEERGQFDLLRSELIILSREWSANALDWFLTQLEPTQAALQAKIITELREQFPRWKLHLPPMLEAWREWLGVFLLHELIEVSHSQQAMFCSPLHRARQHLTRTLHAFHHRLAVHVKAALGVSLTSREFALEVREPSAPPVDVSYAFDVAFTTIGWLISLKLFRGLIERVLLRKARWEVEKNLSRLASDWRDRVEAGINELTRQAERQALDELATLEQTLARTKSDDPRLREAIADLEAAGAGLNAGSGQSDTGL